MKILIADDDAVSRKLIKNICVRLGYTVNEAHDGMKAWETYIRNPSRIVVSDWVMPGLDGLDLCQNIRKDKRPNYAFFFLITGKKTSLQNYTEAMEAGVDDFLYKPVDFHVFRNQLRMAERVLGLLK
jgi:DNA-binding response OmpR family regulator